MFGMVELVVEDVTVEVGNIRLVDQAGFKVGPGELVVIIGENGAGKSSLLQTIAGYLPLTSGHCRIDGREIASLRPLERARLISWLPQSPPIAWPIRVRDAVALGRFAHGSVVNRMALADAKAIEAAMESCHLLELADRAITTLSGGELARVHVARALACKAPLLLADEPVTALDPRHQLAVMDLLRTMVDDGGSALVILHDLALAARFADRIIGMKAGRIVIDANCSVALTASIIRDLFGVEAVVDYERGYPVPVIIR